MVIQCQMHMGLMCTIRAVAAVVTAHYNAVGIACLSRSELDNKLTQPKEIQIFIKYIQFKIGPLKFLYYSLVLSINRITYIALISTQL